MSVVKTAEKVTWLSHEIKSMHDICTPAISPVKVEDHCSTFK